MITPNYLRTLLESAIGQYIGFYKIPQTGGTPLVTKAIAVLPDSSLGDNYPPVNTTVINGLEIVIHKPRPESVARLSSDRLKIYKWELFINQWDNTSLIDAVDLLLDALQDNRLSFTSPTYPSFDKKLGIVPYARIAILEKVVRTVNQLL